MSWKATALVVEGSLELSTTQKFVLLALAAFAHPDGSSAFPSIQTLAAWTNTSPRTAQRALRALLKAGYLTVQEEASNVRPTTYQVVMERLGRGDRLAPRGPRARGDSGDAVGVTSEASRGDTVAPDPNNRSKDRSKGPPDSIVGPLRSADRTTELDTYWHQKLKALPGANGKAPRMPAARKVFSQLQKDGYTELDIRGAIDAWFELREPFVVKNGYAVTQFHQRFAALVRSRRTGRAAAVEHVSAASLNLPPELLDDEP